MDRKRLSTPGLILLTVLLPVAMLMTSSGFAQAPGGQNTSGFLALSGEEAANFDLPPDMQLVQSSYNVQNGLTYERYQQYFGVAQVLGAQVTLYIDDSGTIATVIGAHYPDIAPANFARLSGANARAIVDRDVGAGGNRNVDLLINPETGRYFHRIETQRPYSRWFHWIDADNGRVLNKYDAIETDDGIGVKGDIKIMENMEGLSLTTRHSSGRPQNRGYWLQSGGNRQLTYDDGNNGGVANIMIDDDNHWNDDPRQPAGVDAHFYASVVDDYYWDIHSRNSFNGAGASMVSIVHIGDDLNNAFWNGQQVVYGDGDGIDIRELSGALDVVGHEWTHAVIQYTSNLIYQNESGALSESFSDQVGTSIEFWASVNGREDPTPVPDWLVGEDVWNWNSPDLPGLRNMADPEEYGDSDHYSEWDHDPGDNGGVHTNSGIPNHAFYLLVKGGINASCADADDPPTHKVVHCSDLDDTQDNNLTVIGIGLAVDKDNPGADTIFYGAFMALPSNATICQARAATEVVASSLFGSSSQQLTSTTAAWVAVGLTDTVCGLAGEDTTPPDTTINLSPSNLSSSSDATFWFASTEEGSTFECSLDTVPFSSCTSPQDYPGLADGSHTFQVRATDAADNTDSTPASYAWTIDTSTSGEDSIHVQSIEAITMDLSKGYKKAIATVRIVDSSGNSVGSANVTGEFKGDIDPETQTVLTDDSLVAVLESAQEVKGRLKFTFCVTGVSDGPLPYNSANNVTTCASN